MQVQMYKIVVSFKYMLWIFINFVGNSNTHISFLIRYEPFNVKYFKYIT